MNAEKNSFSHLEEKRLFCSRNIDRNFHSRNVGTYKKKIDVIFCMNDVAKMKVVGVKFHLKYMVSKLKI